MKESMKYRLMMILSMTIFGTIGLFRRFIPLESAALAMLRGFIGSGSIVVLTLAAGKKLDWSAAKKKMGLLILSGVMIGLNWVLLFEAYRYTTIAVATLCYYMSPIFVILASPVVLGEKLTGRKLACVAAALVGMVLISDVIGGTGAQSFTGVLFALGAAVLYASVVMTNKRISGVQAQTKTITQLFSAAVVLLPYILLTGSFGSAPVTASAVAMILLVGLVHTGLAYVLYFDSLEHLPGQTAALFGYIDPVVAVLLSALLLREPMTLLQVVGMALILSATALSEK